MKIVYTKHAIEKFLVLERQGWWITRSKINRTLLSPTWRGVSRFGQETVMSLVDEKHILRIIFNRKGDIIKIVTFHIARRGKYESSL